MGKYDEDRVNLEIEEEERETLAEELRGIQVRGMGSMKALRLYMRRKLTQYEIGQLTTTQFETFIKSANFMMSCIKAEENDKIDKLERKLLQAEELIRNLKENNMNVQNGPATYE